MTTHSSHYRAIADAAQALASAIRGAEREGLEVTVDWSRAPTASNCRPMTTVRGITFRQVVMESVG